MRLDPHPQQSTSMAPQYLLKGREAAHCIDHSVTSIKRRHVLYPARRAPPWLSGSDSFTKTPVTRDNSKLYDECAENGPESDPVFSKIRQSRRGICVGLKFLRASDSGTSLRQKLISLVMELEKKIHDASCGKALIRGDIQHLLYQIADLTLPEPEASPVITAQDDSVMLNSVPENLAAPALLLHEGYQQNEGTSMRSNASSSFDTERGLPHQITQIKADIFLPESSAIYSQHDERTYSKSRLSNLPLLRRKSSTQSDDSTFSQGEVTNEGVQYTNGFLGDSFTPEAAAEPALSEEPTVENAERAVSASPTSVELLEKGRILFVGLRGAELLFRLLLIKDENFVDSKNKVAHFRNDCLNVMREFLPNSAQFSQHCASNNRLLSYLLDLLFIPVNTGTAQCLLEELLSMHDVTLDLARIPQISQLVVSLPPRHLASLSRLLSLLVFEPAPVSFCWETLSSLRSCGKYKFPSELESESQQFIIKNAADSTHSIKGKTEAREKKNCRSDRNDFLSEDSLFHPTACCNISKQNQDHILRIPGLIDRLVLLLEVQCLPLPPHMLALMCGHLPTSGADSAFNGFVSSEVQPETANVMTSEAALNGQTVWQFPQVFHNSQSHPATIETVPENNDLVYNNSEVDFRHESNQFRYNSQSSINNYINSEDVYLNRMNENPSSVSHQCSEIETDAYQIESSTIYSDAGYFHYNERQLHMRLSSSPPHNRALAIPMDASNFEAVDSSTALPHHRVQSFFSNIGRMVRRALISVMYFPLNTCASWHCPRRLRSQLSSSDDANRRRRYSAHSHRQSSSQNDLLFDTARGVEVRELTTIGLRLTEENQLNTTLSNDESFSHTHVPQAYLRIIPVTSEERNLDQANDLSADVEDTNNDGLSRLGTTAVVANVVQAMVLAGGDREQDRDRIFDFHALIGTILNVLNPSLGSLHSPILPSLKPNTLNSEFVQLFKRYRHFRKDHMSRVHEKAMHFRVIRRQCYEQLKMVQQRNRGIILPEDVNSGLNDSQGSEMSAFDSDHYDTSLNSPINNFSVRAPLEEFKKDKACKLLEHSTSEWFKTCPRSSASILNHTHLSVGEHASANDTLNCDFPKSNLRAAPNPKGFEMSDVEDEQSKDAKSLNNMTLQHEENLTGLCSESLLPQQPASLQLTDSAEIDPIIRSEEDQNMPLDSFYFPHLDTMSWNLDSNDFISSRDNSTGSTSPKRENRASTESQLDTLHPSDIEIVQPATSCCGEMQMVFTPLAESQRNQFPAHLSDRSSRATFLLQAITYTCRQAMMTFITATRRLTSSCSRRREFNNNLPRRQHSEMTSRIFEFVETSQADGANELSSGREIGPPRHSVSPQIGEDITEVLLQSLLRSITGYPQLTIHEAQFHYETASLTRQISEIFFVLIGLLNGRRMLYVTKQFLRLGLIGTLTDLYDTLMWFDNANSTFRVPWNTEEMKSYKQRHGHATTARTHSAIAADSSIVRISGVTRSVGSNATKLVLEGAPSSNDDLVDLAETLLWHNPVETRKRKHGGRIKCRAHNVAIIQQSNARVETDITDLISSGENITGRCNNRTALTHDIAICATDVVDNTHSCLRENSEDTTTPDIRQTSSLATKKLPLLCERSSYTITLEFLRLVNYTADFDTDEISTKLKKQLLSEKELRQISMPNVSLTHTLRKAPLIERTQSIYHCCHPLQSNDSYEISAHQDTLTSMYLEEPGPERRPSAADDGQVRQGLNTVENDSTNTYISPPEHRRSVRRFCFFPETGLLMKLLVVYAEESRNSFYKLSLSTTIQSCLRGSDPILQIFVTEAGILEVLLRDIIANAPNSCDLLAEVIRFNPYVLNCLNSLMLEYPDIATGFFEALLEDLLASNVLVRSLLLTLEYCNQLLEAQKLISNATQYSGWVQLPWRALHFFGGLSHPSVSILSNDTLAEQIEEISSSPHLLRGSRPTCGEPVNLENSTRICRWYASPLGLREPFVRTCPLGSLMTPKRETNRGLRSSLNIQNLMSTLKINRKKLEDNMRTIFNVNCQNFVEGAASLEPISPQVHKIRFQQWCDKNGKIINKTADSDNGLCKFPLEKFLKHSKNSILTRLCTLIPFSSICANNLCCLNTALLILMMAYLDGQLADQLLVLKWNISHDEKKFIEILKRWKASKKGEKVAARITSDEGVRLEIQHSPELKEDDIDYIDELEGFTGKTLAALRTAFQTENVAYLEALHRCKEIPSCPQKRDNLPRAIYNLRCLLHFWLAHYVTSPRKKFARELEFSCQIPLVFWTELVYILGGPAKSELSLSHLPEFLIA